MTTIVPGAPLSTTSTGDLMVAVALPGGSRGNVVIGGVRTQLQPGMQSFGPVAAGVAFALTCELGSLVYELRQTSDVPNPIVVSSSAAVDADGRQDGTIWLQTA